MKKQNRRALTLLSLLLTLAMVASACGSDGDEGSTASDADASSDDADADESIAEPASSDIELTVVSWGGAYQNSQQKAYSDPYSEETGVSFLWDESSGDAVAKLRAMNEADNITWDLVDAEAADAIRLCDEGLAEPIDHDAILAPGDDGSTPTDDFGAGLVSECFIPQIVFSTTVGYRTDLVGDTPPTDICALFDTDTYPGKRALADKPLANMEWALLCDGVAKDSIYDVLATEEGQDQAIAKLDTIKDDLVFWSSGADTPQLLADGEVIMGSTFNGRLFNAIEVEGQPIAMLWDAQMYDLDGWIIPSGLPEDRKAAVLEFLYYATDTQRLADQAAWISYGPARASSAPLVGQHSELGIDMAPHMPTDPANATNIFVTNYDFWSDFRDDIDVKFQAWLVG